MLNAERYMLVKEIFLAASNRSPEERLSFLEEACGADIELRTEVESLLSHDDSAEEFMQTPMFKGGPPLNTSDIFATRKLDFSEVKIPPRARPARIGAYAIIDVLGEGGMGVVYLAEQDNPKRRVALKVIRPGLATRDVLRRFEFEAQLLGRLQHSGIAQIFEAGTFDDGDGQRPYYAMELIEGQPLGQYIEENDLDVCQRLELLIKVCEAVHHAHQKGIIHRDLKPGNILVVTEGLGPEACGLRHDSNADAPGLKPQASSLPKILDFGVARAVGADDRQTIQTGAGQLIGTISYMSPEQVSGNPDDLDTRSDVYALGVIGFEMLARALPHEFGRKPIAECARIIRDEDPRKLSEFDKSFRGDLETIFAKALEKNQTRRYQSASDLAADLRRYLKHEPISARPATPLYRYRKSLQRHRWATIGLTAAGGAVVLGVAAWIWQTARTVEQEKFRASQGGAALAQSRNFATTLTQVQLAIAQLNRNQDRPSADILEQLLVELTNQAADAERLNDLDAASRLYGAIGLGYQQLGMYGQSLVNYEHALDARQRISNGDDPALAEALHNVGKGHYWNSNYTTAEHFYRQALDMRVRLFGQRDLSVALSTTHLATCLMQEGLYDQAEALYREALNMRQAIPQTPQKDIGASLNNIGACLYSAGRYDEALALFRQAHDLIGDPADDLEWKPRALRNIAMALIELNRLVEAQEMLSQAIELQQQRLNRAQIAFTQQQLAKVRYKQGRFDEALDLLHQAQLTQESILVPDHLALAETRLLLGRVLLAIGEVRLAEQAAGEALAIRTARLPHNHWQIADAMSVLGEVLLADDRPEQAEPMLLEAHQALSLARPNSDSRVIESINRLVKFYTDSGRTEESQRWQAMLGEQSR